MKLLLENVPHPAPVARDNAGAQSRKCDRVNGRTHTSSATSMVRIFNVTACSNVRSARLFKAVYILYIYGAATMNLYGNFTLYAEVCTYVRTHSYRVTDCEK